MTDTHIKLSFFNFSKTELIQKFGEFGLPSFRVKQVWGWVYNKGVKSFDEMSNVPSSIKELLNNHFTIERPAISLQQNSNDGTIKWLLKFSDKNEAETVFIPEENRGALCVSSQIGCTLNCSFCHTGTQKLVRNLETSEIVGQFLLACDVLNEWPSTREIRKLSNIVMMGMGEPLYNYPNVAKALKIIMDEEGLALSRRRITLSTSGVVPMIETCGQELGVNLAISLHAVNDALRNILVPLNKKYPIKELIDACRKYPASKNSNRITFEYVMLKGINDSVADAKELVKLIRGLPAKVNLIPFNPWPGTNYECSTTEQIKIFADIVNKAGYSSPVRTPRGRDISAACGQLKSASQKISRSILIKETALA